MTTFTRLLNGHFGRNLKKFATVGNFVKFISTFVIYSTHFQPGILKWRPKKT